MKLITIATTTGLGLLTGLILGNTNKNLAHTIGFGAGGALLGGGTVALFYDTKLNKVRNDLLKTVDNLQRENTKLTTLLEVAESLKKDLQKAQDTTLKTISELAGKLSDIKAQLQQEVSQGKELSQDNKRLLTRINELQGEVAELNKLCQEKDATLIDYEKQFDDQLLQEFEKKKQELIKQEVVKEFELTQEAFDTIDEMHQLMSEFYEQHQSQREYFLKTHDRYLEYKENLQRTNQQAYDELAELKDGLKLRVRMLQQTIDEGLIAPQHVNYGLNPIGNKVNALIDWVWNSHQIPLKGLGFSNAESLTILGFDFPRSVDGQELAQKIFEGKQHLATLLWVHEITSVKYDQITERLIVAYRQDKPKPESDDEIYKLGLIPASQFGDRIFINTDHKTKGKPTLRIMSATGGGKGIATKNIVAYFLNLDNWEVWVSDPLHGSEEDYWHCPKIATSPSQSAQAYSAFIKVHKDRQAKRPAITDRFVLGIFDEFDKQHDEDDKKSATEIMTAIRHTKQRQILIGQSGEVGANHWTWDTMKNCSLLFIEDAIGTAIKHDKDLGWSLTKKREIQRKYEKFVEWAAAKNESQNIPGENAYRIALMVVGDRYEFLEIPSAHKGILRNGVGNIRESFAQLELTKNELAKPIEQPEIECTHCQSASFVRHKTHKNPALHNYKCKSCNRLFVAKNNRIS
jgi:gas vesicle protein